MKKIILGVFLLGATFVTHAQANKQDVKTFLELSGNSTKYDEILEQVAEQLSEDKREAFKKDLQGFIDRIIKNDIEKYGIFEYEYFKDYFSYEAYLASPAVYLKVSIGKGYLTHEQMMLVIEYLLTGDLIE